MATLVGNSKYREGHEIILKDKLSGTAKKIFSDKGYIAGSARFKITSTTISLQKKPDVIVDLGTGKSSFLLKDSKNKIVEILGSVSSINGSFNHFSENAKSNTGILTEVKETISMMMFEAFFENQKMMTEDEVLDNLKPVYRSKYDTTYYDSASKQLDELKKYVKSSGYTYELQSKNKTKEVYRQARALSGLSSDNWNPADVWMIKKSFTGFDKKFDSIAELNSIIATAFDKKDIIPISLKNVTAEKASSEIVRPAAKQKVDENLSFEKVDLSDTFNNFILQTKSGFATRVGFKASASTLNVSIEGRMIGAGYQMGAVDARRYAEYTRTELRYKLRNGISVSKSDMDLAKKELKIIMSKYPRVSNTIASYKQALDIFERGNDLTKKRFANLVSFLYSFLIVPKNFEAHMEYCFLSSKKISDKSSVYLILK